MFGLGEALLSFIRRQVGLRTDGASSTGSLHSKAGALKNDIAGIAAKNIVKYSSAIKSIQRGTAVLAEETNSLQVTISAVNTNKAMVNFLGAQAMGSRYRYYEDSFAYAYTGHHFVHLSLDSPTTLNIERAEHNEVELMASYEIIEFY